MDAKCYVLQSFPKKIVKRGKNTTKQTPTKPNIEPIQVQLLHTQTANNEYITAPGRAETEKQLTQQHGYKTSQRIIAIFKCTHLSSKTKVIDCLLDSNLLNCLQLWVATGSSFHCIYM